MARENAAGNAGQELFDARFRAQYCAHHDAMRKILHMRSGYETAIVAEIESIEALTKKVNASIPVAPKGPKVKKPGSAAKRHTKANNNTKKAVGGGKKRQVKACKQKK